MQGGEGVAGDIDIQAYESFISRTLQPRLEELLGSRDSLVVKKEEYRVAEKKLAELTDVRGRAESAGESGESGRDSTWEDDVGQKVLFQVDIGSGVFANALTMESICNVRVMIQDLHGASKEYSIEEGLQYSQSQASALSSKINTLEKDISEVVNDIESCLSNVHQLRALQAA